MAFKSDRWIHLVDITSFKDKELYIPKCKISYLEIYQVAGDEDRRLVIHLDSGQKITIKGDEYIEAIMLGLTYPKWKLNFMIIIDAIKNFFRRLWRILLRK